MFAEDPTVFLQDFGVAVTFGATEGLGILDAPGEYVADGRVITTEYLLKTETSKFGGVTYGDSLTVGGAPYTVREAPLQVDDGAFCLVLLTKAVVTQFALLLEDGIYLLLESGDRLLLES